MTLPSPRVCPRCHAPVDTGVRYCLNCGSPIDPERGKVTEAASYNAQAPYGAYPPSPMNNYPVPNMQSPPMYSQGMPGMQAPLPPNTGAPVAFNQNTPNAGWQAPPSFAYGSTPSVQMPSAYGSNDMAPMQPTPPPPPVVPYSPYPVYNPATAKRRLSKRFYTFTVIGIIVVLAATVGVYALLNHGAVIPGGASGPAASEQLNLTTIYASDQMTFTSVQQAANYADDKNAFQTTTNIVRISMKETQLSKHTSYFAYTQVFRLILPDKSVISPTSTQSYSAPQADVIRTNWVDFGVNAKYDLSSLVLRLGASDEAQILVPLQPNANLSKYQPKTTSQSKTTSYSGVNWAVLSASQSLSADGQQAKTGQVYISVTLSASNPGGESFYGYDFLRLKAGSTEVSQSIESALNMPSIIKSSASNVTMTASFLVQPSATNSYTLVFIADDLRNAAEVDVDFTI